MFTFSLTPPQGPLQIYCRGGGGGDCRGPFKVGGGEAGATPTLEGHVQGGATQILEGGAWTKKRKGRVKYIRRKNKGT